MELKNRYKSVMAKWGNVVKLNRWWESEYWIKLGGKDFLVGFYRPYSKQIITEFRCNNPSWKDRFNYDCLELCGVIEIMTTRIKDLEQRLRA